MNNNFFRNTVNSNNMESNVINLEEAKHNCKLFKQMGIDYCIEDFINKKFPRVDEIVMCH